MTLKRLIPIFFAFVIGFQSFSTLFVIASYFINRNYIATNLCENRFDAVPICKGKCYLGKQLKEREQQERKFPDLKQKEVNLFCQEVSSIGFRHVLTLSTSFFKTTTDNYSSNFNPSVFHPPCVA